MIKDSVEAIKNLIRGRTFAYSQVFQKNSKFSRVVLKDLAKFCRAHETTFHADPRVHAALEGRKEVWHRIQEHLNLDEHELFELHKVKDIPRG